MDFLCKMSVSDIYFKLSFSVTINKFSTTSSASLPLPKICRWRWHPKCPQIWVTASQPLFFPLTYTLSAPPPHFTAPIGWGQQDDGSGRKSGCSKRLHHAALRVSLLLHREEGRQRFAAWPLSVPGITGDGGRTRKEGGGGTQRKREEQYLPVHKWDWTYGYLMRGEGRNWASRKMCERKKYKWEEEEGWRVREQRWGDGGYSHTICVTSLALFLSLLKAREHLRGSPLLHKTKKKTARCIFY